MDLCVVHGELRHGGEIDFVGRRNVLDAGREDDRVATTASPTRAPS